MYAARGVQPHERFCEAKWRPYRSTSGLGHFLNAPTDGAPKNALHRSVGHFFIAIFQRRLNLVHRWVTRTARARRQSGGQKRPIRLSVFRTDSQQS